MVALLAPRGQSFVFPRITLVRRGGAGSAAQWPDCSLEKGMPAFSAANLIAGLIFSGVGTVGFLYGKKMHAWKPMFIGIGLMAYPYFIESTAAICLLGGLGSLALFFFRD